MVLKSELDKKGQKLSRMKCEVVSEVIKNKLIFFRGLIREGLNPV